MSSKPPVRPAEILLVEDSPDDVELTMEGLKEGNVWHNLNVVVDGVEALDFLRRQGDYVNAPEPDIILLDLNLPEDINRPLIHFSY